jgi:hypothetical protein
MPALQPNQFDQPAYNIETLSLQALTQKTAAMAALSHTLPNNLPQSQVSIHTLSECLQHMTVNKKFMQNAWIHTHSKSKLENYTKSLPLPETLKQASLDCTHLLDGKHSGEILRYRTVFKFTHLCLLNSSSL